MKRFLFGLIVCGCAGAVFSAGWFVGFSRREFRTEDTIGREIALLERAKSVPTCQQIHEASSQHGELRMAELRVFWRIDPVSKRMTRLVISPQLDVGYEEVLDPCSN